MKWTNWQNYQDLATGKVWYQYQGKPDFSASPSPHYGNSNMVHGNPQDVYEVLSLISSDRPTIMEVGVTSKEPCLTGGCTYAFASFCYENNGHFIGVDIKSNNINNSIQLTWEFLSVCSFWVADILEISHLFDRAIALLYLDSWLEGSPPENPKDYKSSDYVRLFESFKIPPELVMIDDVRDGGGKGKLIIPHLLANGYDEVFNRNERAAFRRSTCLSL